MKFLLPQGRGRQAESLACRYLEKQGLDLIEKNYSCRLGEVDLIMQDGESLVFIEVKYRNNDLYGHASEAVGRRKQAKVIKTALHYLQTHHRYREWPMRFDVVTIEGEAGKDIQWLSNAFMAEY
ncbi:MAG: YraN family protein [Gammaproteobacteria bacterium]|nr:YraN family protein [Gammaproteobacteria bacterium]